MEYVDRLSATGQKLYQVAILNRAAADQVSVQQATEDIIAKSCDGGDPRLVGNVWQAYVSLTTTNLQTS